MLMLLAPVLVFFAIQFRHNVTRYAGRRGGRRLNARQALALIALIGLLLGAIIL